MGKKPFKSQIKIPSQEEYCDELCLQMFTDVFSFILQQEQQQGKEFGKLLSISFIRDMISGVIYRELISREGQGKSDKEAFQDAADAFSSVKEKLQEAISDAFQEALQEYSSKPCEYYCIIKPVPTPVNKNVN